MDEVASKLILALGRGDEQGRNRDVAPRHVYGGTHEEYVAKSGHEALGVHA